MTADRNPVAPETVENPFPFWAWLRREAAVGALLERFERFDLVERGEALRHKPGLVVRRLERLRVVPG